MTRNVPVVLALVALAAAACSGSTASTTTKASVPPEFLPACGHPGTSVVARHVPVTIRHKDCDLTGVTVSVARRGGAVVGAKPGGVGNSQGFTLTVAKHTLDVTINARGPVGDA